MAVQSWVPTVVAVPLVGLMLFRRYQRTFGKQVFSFVRMVLRMALLAVICGLYLVATRTALGFAAAAAGLAIGTGLAVVSLRTTHLEVSPDGKFYTPNVWIGLAVTALFLGRLLARMATFYMSPATMLNTGETPLDGLQRSPLTLGIFCLTAAYYIVYFGGIIRHMRRLEGKAPPEPEPEEA